MINKVGRNALRIDHVSDHIKVILIFLGFGIYYECQELWILSFLAWRKLFVLFNVKS